MPVPTLRLLSVLLLLLGSCKSPLQGYAGESRPDREVATLSVCYDAHGTTITIESINGLPVEVEPRGVVEILPGRCELIGRARGFAQPRQGAPYTIDFLAKSGGSYLLLLDQPNRSERLLVSVQDRDSKESLASLDYWP